MSRSIGRAPSDPVFLDELQRIEEETGSITHVSLARDTRRNLIRNSGQYWKALGLYNGERGKINLSSFGRMVANGDVTPTEFAATVIKTLELPNRRIESPEEVSKWDTVNLKIKPLELIIRILNKLERQKGASEAYLTPEELIKITIPLSGSSASLEIHADAIFKKRSGQLSCDNWPDCAPEANDRRVAREFLLFLAYYGFCKKDENNGSERYYLTVHKFKEIENFTEITVPDQPEEAYPLVADITITSAVAQDILERRRDPEFRERILAAYDSKCLFTGVRMAAVLEAAHIKPVCDKGPCDLSNGICLRSDIHQLFDSGHLRIHPTGQIYLSTTASKEFNYGAGKIPSDVRLPTFINRVFLEWRWRYC